MHVHELSYCNLVHVGAGAYAGCAYCTMTGEYSNVLDKMIYPDHRRFLSPGDVLRRDDINFPMKVKHFTQPPLLKTTSFVHEANKIYVDETDANEKKMILQQTGCKGPYALHRSPLHERILNTPVEPMHVIKNVVKRMVELISGQEDSQKVRMEEKRRNRFRSSWITKEGSKLPAAPFVLSKEQLVLANERAVRVLVPAGFDWRPRAIFAKPAGMKSHEWKQVATHGILKFCLRNTLGHRQRQSLFQLFDVLSKICLEVMSSDVVDKLKEDVHIVLACIERDFPMSIQVITLHLLHHLPLYLERFGPVYSFWMFPFERFNSWISRRVLNRRYPESNIVETYRLSEWAQFMHVTGHLPDGSLADDKDDGGTEVHVYDGKEDCLTMDIIEDLHSYYYQEVEEYHGLYERYISELRQGRKRRVKCVQPMSEWDPNPDIPLTGVQKQICLQMSTQGTIRIMKWFTYQDEHHRTIKFSRADAEHYFSHTRSSYVSNEARTKVGQIVSIFSHRLVSQDTVFARICWFDGPYVDGDSRLCYVFTTTEYMSVVPIKEYTRPHVVAMDDEEPEKLWILDL